MANRLINNWAQLVAIAAVCLSALLIGQSTLRWLANPTAESLLKEVKVHDLLAQVTDPSLSGAKEVRKVNNLPYLKRRDRKENAEQNYVCLAW